MGTAAEHRGVVRHRGRRCDRTARRDRAQAESVRMPRRVRRPDEGEPEAHSPRRTATHFTVGERKVCWIRREGRKVRGARCRRSCATLPSAWYPTHYSGALPCQSASSLRSLRSSLRRMLPTCPVAVFRDIFERFRELPVRQALCDEHHDLSFPPREVVAIFGCRGGHPHPRSVRRPGASSDCDPGSLSLLAGRRSG